MAFPMAAVAGQHVAFRGWVFGALLLALREVAEEVPDQQVDYPPSNDTRFISITLVGPLSTFTWTAGGVNPNSIRDFARYLQYELFHYLYYLKAAWDGLGGVKLGKRFASRCPLSSLKP